MSHPTKAIISLDRLCHNYNRIKEILSPNCKIICVVKADAYGHGAENCALALRYSCGADFFAVANIDEAISLRNSIGGGPDIMILGYTAPEDAKNLCAYNITQTVFSRKYADELSRAYKSLHFSPQKKIKVHLKVDTGMNRLGFSCDENGIDDLYYAANLDCFEAEGIYTHFACSDEPENPMTKEQFDKFLFVTSELENRGLTFKMKHACNSAATINFPNMHLDAVRCGILLFGLMPSEESVLTGVLPVMTLRTEISHVHVLKKGESISYGASYTADRDIRVATLPIGYADGYIRAYAKNGWAQICGKKAKILGRICMDQCMVDISDIPEASEGTEAIMFGDSNRIDELARASYTLNYETVCLVGKRVKRIFV